MIKFDEVITKLNAKRSGDNYIARCPAHDDRKPSLTIFEQEDGSAHFYCHAHCKWQEVVKALESFDINTNKSYSHPYEKDNNNFIPRISSLDWIKQNSTATYIYRDEENNPKFLVRRYKTLQEEKNFRQYSFIDSNHLKPGLNNQKKLLYRLPELIQAVKDHKDIYIVEGEKDVENLYKIGLTATTCPEGGGKWKDYFNIYFKDARVIIIPDNDKTGHEHAKNIASNLSGLASEIKIVNLPGLQEKQDVSDFLLIYHHSKEELIDIVKNTSILAPVVKEEKKSKITPIEPLPPKNDKIYTLQEVREEIVNTFYNQKDKEDILIKTLPGTGKTVTILKEINKIMEENEGATETFVIKERYLRKIINKNKKNNIYTPGQIAILKSIENKKMRYSEMFKYLHSNNFTIEDATNIIINSLPFKNCKFAYAAPFIKSLEDLQKAGILSSKYWKIIYGRKQKDNENPDGNCYMKKEIDKLLERRINPTNKICNHTDCPYYKECSSDENMYIGQWNTDKNIALTHMMLAMARGRLKDIHRLIIDENPLTSFMEPPVSIVNTSKLEDTDNRIDLAVRDFERSLNTDDKKALPLFKALKNVIYNTRLQGRKESKYICLAGRKFMEDLEKEYCKLSLKPIESILEIPDIRENDNYHFRQDLHNILKEEISLWKEKGNYNARIYVKYYKGKKNSPERIEFYFRNKRELVQNYKSIIALDATTDTLIWNKLFNTSFKELKMEIKLPEGYKHIQSITGGYGKNYHNQCLNSTDRKLIDKEIELYLALGGHEKVAIFGWKKVIEYIAKELKLPCHEIGSNFYGIKGSNQYENYEIALILGTSNVNINELQELTSCLFYDEDVIDFTTEEKEVRYNTNIDGKDYTIKIRTATDKRYNAMWQNNREGELTQVANRVRPLLNPRTIVSLSNIPLQDLPPTELIEFDDLLKKCKEENILKMAAVTMQVPNFSEFPGIPETKQEGNEKKKEEVELVKPDEIEKGSLPKNEINFKPIDYKFNEIVEKNIWFCKKHEQVLTELFKVKETLMNSQCYQVTKVLYNIEIENNIKNIDSLIALLLPDNTLDFTSVSPLSTFLKKDKMFFQRSYEKFCSIYKLKSQKNIISYGRGKMFYINIGFIPSSPSEELDVNVIRSEYEKFNKYKDKGQVLKLMFNIDIPVEEDKEQYTEEDLNLAAALAENILNSEPVFTLKTSRSTFLTSPHLPCLLNCNSCRNLNQCAAEYEEYIRSESELCLT